MSTGKITRETIYDSAGIKTATDELITQLEKLPKEFVELGKAIKSAGGLKEFMELSKRATGLGDQYSESLKKLTTSIEKLTKSLSKSSVEQSKTNKSTAEGVKLRERTKKAIIQNRLAQKGLTAELVKEKVRQQELNRVLRERARQELGIRKRTSGLVSGFKTLGAQLRNLAVAYLGVQTVIRGFQDIFKVTKTLDAIGFAQQRVIQSQTEFAQTNEFLSRIINDYGLDLVAVTERYTKFRAATNSSNLTALQTQKIFESVSKASSVLGLKTDELRGVYLALEQMISKGTVTTEELRRQLGERLPGAFQIMAEALGTNTQGLNKMLRAGEVLAEDALPKFIIALEKAYGIESVKKVDTLTAAQNRLRTAWIEFIKLMEGAGFFKGILNGLASVVKWIGDNINTIGHLTKSILLMVSAWGAWKLSMIATNAIIKLNIKGLYAQIAATKLSTVATKGLKNAMLALNTAIKKNPVGFLASALLILLSSMQAFKALMGDTTDEVKDFNVQITEEQKKLDLLFSSLKNAKQGTKEWTVAKQTINREYGEYLTNLITEKSTLEDIAIAQKEVNMQSLASIAISDKDNKVTEAGNQKMAARAEAIETMQKIFDELGMSATESGVAIAKFEDLTQQIADGSVSVADAVGQILPEVIPNIKSLSNAWEDTEKAVNINVQGLQDYNRVLKDSDDFMNAYLKSIGFVKKESKELFDEEKFAKGLQVAKKDFQDFSLLRTEETRRYFKENSKFVDDDTKTYKAYLLNLLKLHKDNINARIIIEKELSGLDGKGDGAVSAQRQINKQLLEEEKSRQEQDLALSIKALTEKGRSKEQIDDFIEDQDRENKIALFNLQIEQNQKLLDLAKGDAKEQAKIRADIAKSFAEISKLQADGEISESERVAREKKRILEQEDRDIDDSGNQQILKMEKRASDLIMAEVQRFKKREISQKEFSKNIEDIERDLQNQIIDILIETLKLKLPLYEDDPKKYKEISDQILNLESQKSQGIIDSAIKTAMTQAEIDQTMKELKKALVNEVLNFTIASLENQLAAAEQARDFEVALAGSNVEQRIKAERKFEKENAEIKRKQANAQKAQAAFNIITNTADAIIGFLADPGGFPGLALSILAGSIGALQLGTVLSAPVPTFAEGTDSHKGGLAIIGDKKGDKTLTKKGGSELVVLPTGEAFLSSAFPTMMDLPKGTQVKSEDKTKRLLAQNAMRSAYEGVDMGKSERYLKDIRDKENIVYKDGYKIVTRKNFKGVYATRI